MEFYTSSRFGILLGLRKSLAKDMYTHGEITGVAFAEALYNLAQGLCDEVELRVRITDEQRVFLSLHQNACVPDIEVTDNIPVCEFLFSLITETRTQVVERVRSTNPMVAEPGTGEFNIGGETLLSFQEWYRAGYWVGPLLYQMFGSTGHWTGAALDQAVETLRSLLVKMEEDIPFLTGSILPLIDSRDKNLDTDWLRILSVLDGEFI